MRTVGQPPRCCTSSFKGRNLFWRGLLRTAYARRELLRRASADCRGASGLFDPPCVGARDGLRFTWSVRDPERRRAGHIYGACPSARRILVGHMVTTPEKAMWRQSANAGSVTRNRRYVVERIPPGIRKRSFYPTASVRSYVRSSKNWELGTPKTCRMTSFRRDRENTRPIALHRLPSVFEKTQVRRGMRYRRSERRSSNCRG